MAADWPAGSGPYNPRRIALAIEERRVELGVTVKALVADPILARLGLASKGRYSLKMHCKEDYSIEQISRLCVLLDGWPGFPFVPRELGMMYRRLLERASNGR